ncbi:MAG: hypothetical protein EP344_14690 [Bacteroidetes bacterium]|nr:MAG: hypothetical protein EP344_14690 [Bacteroidota bacterium]
MHPLFQYNPSVRTFLTGLGLGIAGTLPISPVNLTLLQVGLQSGVYTAIYFAAGMLLLEVLFIRLSLGGLKQLLERTIVRRLLNRTILILLVVLALASFHTAFFREPGTTSIFTPATLESSLVSGLIFRLLNPSMILYWLGTNATLLARDVLPPRVSQFNVYASGCLAGIAVGLAPYIYGGAYLAEYLKPWHTALNILIGCFFLLVAGWMIFNGRINSGLEKMP